MRVALSLLLGACTSVWQPPGGAVVADRGTLRSSGGTEETFVIADRADGGHIIHDDLAISRLGRTYHEAGTLVVDVAWRPLEGTFQERGVTLRLFREHGVLVVKNPDGAIVASEAAPTDVFYSAYTGAIFLEGLCAVRGRKQLSMFPDRSIIVDGEPQSDEETAAAASAYHFTPRDHVILVSVTGGLAAELVCDGRALVAVKQAGEVFVRPGYESLGQIMP